MDEEFNNREPGSQSMDEPTSAYVEQTPRVSYQMNSGRPYYEKPRGFGLTALLVVAVLSALLGGIGSAYLAPTYLYGKYLPWPQAANQGGYQLPELTGESPADLAASGVVAQVAALVEPAVVGITTKVVMQSGFRSYENEAVGSGVIFDAQGYIVTNNHVVEGARELIVTIAPGVETSAQLVGSDSVTDLAVIKINPALLPEEYRDLTVAQFGDSDAVRVGELAVAIGNPLGLQFQRSVTAGIISALNRDLEMEGVQLKLMQTDAAINSGNSGGALVDKDGRVIGINQAKIQMEGVEGMGFAIPVNTARPIIEQLIRSGKVVRPFLGVTVYAELSAQLNRTYNLGTDVGLYISEVAANSPAALAGMRQNDILVKIGDSEIKTFNDLQRELFAREVGEKVQLTIVRDRQQLTLTATLAATP